MASRKAQRPTPRPLNLLAMALRLREADETGHLCCQSNGLMLGDTWNQGGADMPVQLAEGANFGHNSCR